MIPEKNEIKNQKLTEYINNDPERSELKSVFMQESEGVYHFGSKCEGLKFTKDKIEIRVGRGFFSIDEFLD